VKKYTYSFTGNLITQPLIHSYQKSVRVSQEHQTSFSEMWTQETMQLRTVCDKRLQVPITSGDFEAKFFCGDIQQTLYLKEVCELILMN